jgi:amino acid transporter
MALAALLFGRPLRSEEEAAESVGIATGIPVLGLDALASAAYGPEAALVVLLPAGMAGVYALAPISLAIVGLLAILAASYRQTIGAYPGGGGSYSVAKENLGRWPGLLAASALGLDYVLNVAVAISAGVAALVSAFPSLLPHTLALCLAILALISLANLRGVRSAGVAFMVPTYLFVLCLGLVLARGAWRFGVAGAPEPVVPPPHVPAAAEGLTAWLVLRAFASGCTAATGVEAVSNAVPIFRRPSVARARRTLVTIVAILAVLVAGQAWLCRVYGVGAAPPAQVGFQSVWSQLVGAVAGRGAFYYVTMAAIVGVLCLSANTSFAGFPRLCRVLALDELMPGAFAHRGRRLVYSRGILLLMGAAGLLLVAFDGVTDRLIPLFAVGAFLAFTLSQAGMVAHWRRVGGRGARRAMAVNALGALATSVALVVIVASKLTEGAWITVLAIPLALAVFAALQRHFRAVDRQVAAVGPLDLAEMRQPLVIVPLHRLDRLARKALRFALQISPHVQAVQFLTETPDEQEDLTADWPALVEAPAAAAGVPSPNLFVVRSSYRELLEPFAEHVRRMAAVHPDRDVAVLVSQLVDRRWYHAFLHSHRSSLMKAVLLLRGGPRVVVMSAPWRLTGADPSLSDEP